MEYYAADGKNKTHLQVLDMKRVECQGRKKSSKQEQNVHCV